ncbi:MAG: phage portal protein [Thermoleophilia bacterium]
MDYVLRSIRPGRLRRAAGEWGDSSIPSWSSVSMSDSGIVVTRERAESLSAVSQAIRQPAVLAAGLPLDVYDVSPDRKVRTLARGKWQNQLLDQPDSSRPGHEFWSDLSSHVDGYGNAAALKVWDGPRVGELILLDPERIRLKVDPKTRVRTYTFLRPDSSPVEIPGGNILHVRGWDPRGAPWARSPVQRHADALGRTLAQSQMAQRYLRNDARPGVVIKMPAQVTRAQAQEFLDLWDERNRGNPGRANLIGRGGDITTLPVSLKDAQFVETENLSLTDTARIFDWMPELLGRPTDRDFVQVLSWMVRLHLMPRLQRVEAAFGDDPDLFGARSKFRPYHDVSELLRGDAATMAEVFHQLKQVGIITANEARVPLGWPPIEGGDELQATPVGGAPNADPPPDQGTPQESPQAPATTAPRHQTRPRR